jgi:hypothetical protein
VLFTGCGDNAPTAGEPCAAAVDVHPCDGAAVGGPARCYAPPAYTQAVAGCVADAVWQCVEACAPASP